MASSRSAPSTRKTGDAKKPAGAAQAAKPAKAAKATPAKAAKTTPAKAAKPAKATPAKPAKATPAKMTKPARATTPTKATPAKAAPRLSAAERVEAIRETERRLVAAHPDAHCELDHQDPFQLIVATVMSAQTTDVAVNKVTPGLFARFPDAASLAAAEPSEVEPLIDRIGMFRQKAKNIVGLAKGLVKSHGGQVPADLDSLVALPGVGRKTANVVLGVAFGKPEGVVVDTHVQRLSQRLGWTHETTPEKIEKDLMTLFPRSEWDRLSHTLIFHGRRVCAAARPACSTCSVNDRCPSAFAAEQVGRKAPRLR